MGSPRNSDRDPSTFTAEESEQKVWDDINAVDERAPDRSPATPIDITTDPMTVAPDNRQPAQDAGRALNQMAGRAAITENHDPNPGAASASAFSAVTNPAGEAAPADGGEEVQLLRGYQPDENGPKRLKGEVMTVSKKDAKRLVNMGVARFTETD